MGDKDQVTVNRQKTLALADCEKLGLPVDPKHIYIDNGRSAWKRNRKRPGWDALMDAARNGLISRIMCYHPDRLMRQPHDLEELLSVSDIHGIVLYGRVNRRDLQDPDDRYALRIEVAHACRSSDDTSRRLKDALDERAREGKPATGIRRFGYDKTGMKIIPKEAEIVREVYKRFLQGESPYSIAGDLNDRGIRSVRGKKFTTSSINWLLKRHHQAGILVHRGEIVGDGIWPAIIDRGTWDEVQKRFEYRSVAFHQRMENSRFYLLRGSVTCNKCGVRMHGSNNNGNASYMCNRSDFKGDKRCARRINAEKLEEFVAAATVNFLTRLDISGQRIDVEPEDTRTALEQAEDEKRLQELNQIWIDKEITSAEYRQMRKDVTERMRKRERKVSRPPLEILEGLTGENAQTAWDGLRNERKNAVIRFLFSDILIGERTAPIGKFDYGRVNIVQNQL